MNYCTPVPSRRISVNARLELRIATEDAAVVRVAAIASDCRKFGTEEFPLTAGLALNRIYPRLNDVMGKIRLDITFLDSVGRVLETKHQDYEIIASPVTSTRLLDRLTPTKPVALAPNNIHMHWYPEQWHEILQYLDILIPFAFARSEYNLTEIAQMCARTGTHFWVDMEIFANPFEDGLRPKSCPELIEEIRHYDVLEQIYGYQFTGLMNEPGHRMELGGADTEELYTAYRAYVQRIYEEMSENR